VTNVLRAVAGVLMVGLMSPSRAYADPVTITSGVFSHIILGPFSGNLSGMDASERSFSFEGEQRYRGWCALLAHPWRRHPLQPRVTRGSDRTSGVRRSVVPSR
jgi:hypothetical protein